MGFFSRIKDASGYVVNFKVTSWMGLDHVKSMTKGIFGMSKEIFTPDQANVVETFDEAMARLHITQEQLEQRKREFVTLLIIFLLISAGVFSYGLFIMLVYKNILGFIMCIAITLFALSHAFKYHFWIYQIKHKKLGCTLREWFLDKR